MKTDNNKKVGLVCVVLGAVFFLAGIVILILENSVNLYTEKVEATIVSRYKIEDAKEPYNMLGLAYKVGDKMIYTAYSTTDEISDEEATIEIYYNVKDPKQVLEGGWHFEAVIPTLFGVLILMTGLYYMEVISFGFEPSRKPGNKASELDKKYYLAKERTENNLIPLFGVISFIVFGVFMIIDKRGWWAWLFVIIGAIGVIYFVSDLIPAVSELLAYNRLKKIKKGSLSVDDDFEQFEKKLKEKENKKKNRNSDEEQQEEVKKDEFEVEETIEIKSLNTKHKKKK